jgi:hypothetical protein
MSDLLSRLNEEAKGRRYGASSDLASDAAKHIGQQRIRIKKLEAILADCAAFLETYSDVSDGNDGIPVPNAAMALLSEINEEIT